VFVAIVTQLVTQPLCANAMASLGLTLNCQVGLGSH
jgi:hypothetical protein